jgi:DNA-binding MarR family transcriptional regulator
MTTNSLLESYLKIKRVLAALRAQEMKNLDFGANQISVLYRLSLSDATMGELVEYASTDKASMTRTIASLVSSGLVRRKSDAEDRRVIRIELTAKGKEKASVAKKVRTNIEKKLEESLSSKDRQAFSSLVDKLTDYLNAHS